MTREELIEAMARELAYPSSIAGVPVTIVDNLMRDEAAKVLPVVVEAVLASIEDFADTWDETRPTESISTTRLRKLLAAIRAEWGRSE